MIHDPTNPEARIPAPPTGDDAAIAALMAVSHELLPYTVGHPCRSVSHSVAALAILSAIRDGRVPGVRVLSPTDAAMCEEIAALRYHFRSQCESENDLCERLNKVLEHANQPMDGDTRYDEAFTNVVNERDTLRARCEAAERERDGAVARCEIMKANGQAALDMANERDAAMARAVELETLYHAAINDCPCPNKARVQELVGLLREAIEREKRRLPPAKNPPVVCECDACSFIKKITAAIGDKP